MLVSGLACVSALTSVRLHNGSRVGWMAVDVNINDARWWRFRRHFEVRACACMRLPSRCCKCNRRDAVLLFVGRHALQFAILHVSLRRQQFGCAVGTGWVGWQWFQNV